MREAIVTGLVTGWAIAMPIGGIAILLVTLGAQRGLGLGLPGALGVGVVDGIYAALAATAGGPLGRALAPYEKSVHIASTVVLIGVGLSLMYAAFRPTLNKSPLTPTSPWGSFATMAGLTLINPMTIAYFTAVVLNDPTVVDAPSSGVAFVGAAWVASTAWQCALVVAGVAFGAVLTGNTGRRFTGAFGGVLVLGIAVVGLL